MPDVLAELADVVGRSLMRGEYLNLLDAGVSTPQEIVVLPETELAAVLPATTARALLRLLDERGYSMSEAGGPTSL